MSYVYLQKIGQKLRFILSDQGRAELAERLDNHDLIGSDDTFYELIEDYLCNGWEIIRPEEIGALTDAPILSDDTTRNENGELTEIGAVYWFPAYQVLSPSAELYENGYVDFQRAE